MCKTGARYRMSRFVVEYRGVAALLALLWSMSIMGFVQREEKAGLPSLIGPFQLHRYSLGQISQLLESLGYEKVSISSLSDVSRNGAGTALRIVDQRRRVVISLGCDGTVKRITLPGRATWLNDKNEVVAWLEGGLVHYQDGSTEPPPFKAEAGIDPSGSFFVKEAPWSADAEQSRRTGTSLFGSAQPRTELAKTDLLNVSPFIMGDCLVAFGREQGDKNNVAYQKFLIRDGRLQPAESGLIKRPTESPAPFYVKDANPETMEVLLIDARDWPSRHVWYRFDMASGLLTRIGPSSDIGVYLRCDVLKAFPKR